MKGKITEITPNGSWQSEHGEMFVYLIKIDADGIPFEGQANAKSAEVEKLPYKTGEEVEFEHTESGNQYPDKLKITKEGGSYQQPKPQKGSNASFALSYAKDIAVAKIYNNGGAKAYTEDIIEQAESFLQWLNK